MATKLEDIVKKHAFMYEISDNVYCIGNGVFRKCRDSLAYTYFERYKECISRVGSERIEKSNLNTDEIEDVIYNFRKVRNYSEFDQNKDNPIQAKEDALKFIDSLSAKEAIELEKQLNDFINIFKNYYHPKYPYN
ncbi:MAG: hypothetical protein IKU39_00445 [Lachnospiraceae bacterium]|nr:hypothetical protein [Lachnospiraceae bacterium]